MGRLMRWRQAMMSQTQREPRLPAEYQEVEYLESPGLCYVQKDIQLYANDIISADVMCQLLATDREQWFAGWFGQVPVVPEFGIYMGGWYTANGARYALLDGSGITGKYKATLQNVSIPSQILMDWRSFARGGTNVANKINQPACRIWSSTVSINDILVLDWVPCYRKADATPGMYDLVSGTFFTNQGTGEFVVGADIN